ncbi:MAG: four-carbon acid sugar kinase family protein [Dehalococcoidia bacterium]|nr:four-carbon acid sugar kinase family protein [Dehalococcoidia bacterium]
MASQIGIIASDLTGALDTAAVFHAVERNVVALLDMNSAYRAPITVVVTDSAEDSPERAYEKVRDAARLLRGRVFFKKVDSTMRGNVGPEIAALVDELGPKKVLVCPALPREGRTVVDGMALLRGVPTHLTEYGQHPVTPCVGADVVAVLAGQAHMTVTTIGLDTVRRGPEHLAEIVEASLGRAIVLDASTDDDVRIIGRVCAEHAGRWLPCGSSGLARAFAEAMRERENAEEGIEPAIEPVRSPVLVVVGSRNQATIAQLKSLRAEGIYLILDVGAEALCQRPDSTTLQHAVDLAVTALQRGESVVITASLSPYVPHLRHQVSMRLGEMTRDIVIRQSPGDFVLTGGATAWAVAYGLGATALQVEGELEPGLISARLVDGSQSGARVVTKAGGFGDTQMLDRTIRAAGQSDR